MRKTRPKELPDDIMVREDVESAVVVVVVVVVENTRTIPISKACVRRREVPLESGLGWCRCSDDRKDDSVMLNLMFAIDVQSCEDDFSAEHKERRR